MLAVILSGILATGFSDILLRSNLVRGFWPTMVSMLHFRPI